MEIGNPSPDDIENDCARIRFRLRNLLGDIDVHEVRTRNETEDLRALISSVSGLVRYAMEQQSSGIAGYQPGDYIHLLGLQEAYMNTVSSISYRRRNSEGIRVAVAYAKGITTALEEEKRQKELREEKEKENRDKGVAKAIGGHSSQIHGVIQRLLIL